jgi:hypothetical protein
MTNLTTPESMRYLGAPIAARKMIKLKSVKLRLEEMDIRPGKIMSSPLFTVQKIDVVKTFFLPSIDFLLLDREVGVAQLQTMNRKNRRSINEEMRIKRVPVEYHYASWRDRGLSSLNLQDSGHSQ